MKRALACLFVHSCTGVAPTIPDTNDTKNNVPITSKCNASSINNPTNRDWSIAVITIVYLCFYIHSRDSLPLLYYTHYRRNYGVSHWRIANHRSDDRLSIEGIFIKSSKTLYFLLKNERTYGIPYSIARITTVNHDSTDIKNIAKFGAGTDSTPFLCSSLRIAAAIINPIKYRMIISNICICFLL